MTKEVKIILIVILWLCIILPLINFIVGSIKSRKNKNQESNKKENKND